MQLKIKLKKRWITGVLKQADAASAPMPWVHRKNQVSSRLQRATAPRRVRQLQA